MRWSAKQNCTFLTPLRGYTSSVSSVDSFSSRRSLSKGQCPSPTVCWSRGLHPKGTSSRFALRAPRQRARWLAMTRFLHSAPIVGAHDHTGPFVILSVGRSPESKDPFFHRRGGNLRCANAFPSRGRCRAQARRMRWSAKQNCTFLTPLRGYTSSVSFADSFSSRRSLSEGQCLSPTIRNDSVFRTGRKMGTPMACPCAL